MERNERRSPNFDNPPDPLLLEIQGQLRDVWELLHGKEGKMGLCGKVTVMWQLHIWIALLAGTMIGAVIEKLIH